MRKLTTLLALAACLWLTAAGSAEPTTSATSSTAPAASQSVQTIVLPGIGLSLSLPDTLEVQCPSEPLDALKAIDASGKAGALAVTLTAMPADPGKTIAEIADEMLKQFDRNMAVRNLTIRKTVTLKVAGAGGVVQLISYAFHGVKSTAARLYFARQATGQLRLCYILTVDSSPDREPEILPVLAALVRTLKTVEVCSPASAPASVLPHPVEDARSGVSIKLPAGWHFRYLPAGSGVAFAATDYLQGNVESPAGNVIVMDSGSRTARDVAKSFLSADRRANKATDVKIEVLSEGPIRMANLGGYEFVLRHSPVKSIDGKAPRPVIFVQRTVCRAATGKSYTLVTLTDNPDLGAARRLADTLSDGFEFIAILSASGPASEPTIK